MYLYDYQLNLTKKINRGGNFILHGPRRIGITTILLMSALRKASRYDCANIIFFTATQDLVNNLREDIFNIIYASKVINVSPFEDGFDIKHNDRSKFIFNNETTVELVGINSEWPITLEGLPKKEMIVLDTADRYELDENEIKQLLSRADQIVVGASSGVSDEHFVHRLWHYSITGKNDFQYIRIPLSVTTEPNLYNNMREKLTQKSWLKDVELVYTE